LISIATLQGLGVDVTADKDGRFYSDALRYFDSAQLIIQTNDARGRKSDLGFVMDPFISPARSATYRIPSGIIVNEKMLEGAEQTSGVRKDTLKPVMLKGVEVKGTKIEPDTGPAIPRL